MNIELRFLNGEKDVELYETRMSILINTLYETSPDIAFLRRHSLYDIYVKYAYIALHKGELVACVPYKKEADRLRPLVCAHEDTPVGFAAAKMLYKTEIERFGYKYWVEVSGKTKHLFNEFGQWPFNEIGGYTLPSRFAPFILEDIERKFTGIRHERDGLSYKRWIGPTLEKGNMATKSIYAFRSKKLYDEVCKSANSYITHYIIPELSNREYGDMIEDIMASNKDSYSKDDPIIATVFKVTDALSDLNSWEYFDEFPPQWFTLADKCTEILNKTDGSVSVSTHLEALDYIKTNVTPITIHEFNIQ